MQHQYPDERIEQPTLTDPWESTGSIPLDRALERVDHSPAVASFWRVVQALALMGVAFVLFQLVSSVVAIILLLLQGVPSDRLMVELTENLDEHAALLLLGNTSGQILGLALPALLVAGFHTSRRRSFLRLRPVDPGLFSLSVLGLVALLPVVQWLGQVNSALPLPDWVRALEEAQMQLIEQVLAGGTGVFFNLLVLAVTPAFCEELLFRGYVQRQAERALGVAAAILFSGLFFGLYHLRLTQLLPLTLLGVYLAYITWRTGSLWPAVVVHFANNAFAVALGAVASARPGWSLDEIEAVAVPGYVVAVGVVAIVAVVFVMDRTARNVLDSGVTDSLRL